jgi:hypothetical protein
MRRLSTLIRFLCCRPVWSANRLRRCRSLGSPS